MSNKAKHVVVALGDVTFESKVRAESLPDSGLRVYGVSRNEGLTPDAKYTSKNLDRYKVLRPGMFTYNPMRLNIGSIAYCTTEHSIGLVSPDYVVFGCKPENLDPNFLHYVIRGAEWQQWTNAAGVGSVRVRIYFRELSKMLIYLPPLPQQKAIAQILGTLDDKIKLNQRMNVTLEEMAKAVFRSWFVDFDPIRAKIDDYVPVSFDSNTFTLFPTHFQESTLGSIPFEWRVASIYEIADVIYGAPFASNKFNTAAEGKLLIRIRDLADENPGVWTPEAHPKGYTVQPGDIVVGMDGEFRAYLWGGPEAWLNQRLCVFAPKPPYSAAFVRNSILDLLAQVEATETATTVIHLGKNDIDRFKVVVPSENVIKAFSRICQPLYDRIVANKQQSRTLAALRDTLLPKLLSGELRVAYIAQDATNIVSFPDQTSKKPAKKTTDEFVEAVVIAQLVRKIATPEFPLGRMRYNKLAYLAHRRADEDVTHQYLKKAAGPYSPWAKYGGPEKIAEKNGYVKTTKAGVYSGLISGDHIDKIDQYLPNYPVCAAIDWVVDKFRFRKKDDLELLATVDFAALDLLREGQSVTREAIKHVIAANKEWAPKLDRAIFSDESVDRALAELAGLFPATYQK